MFEIKENSTQSLKGENNTEYRLDQKSGGAWTESTLDQETVEDGNIMGGDRSSKVRSESRKEETSIEPNSVKEEAVTLQESERA